MFHEKAMSRLLKTQRFDQRPGLSYRPNKNEVYKIQKRLCKKF